MKKRSIFDYFFLIRPVPLAPIWIFMFAGYRIARMHFDGNLPFPCLDVPGKMWSSFVIYNLLVGAIYIINQIMDIETDKINRKLFLLADGYIPVWHAWVETILLVIVPGIIAYMYFPTAYLVVFVISLIMGVFYSVPPIAVKNRPIWDTFANAVGNGFLAFAAGWLSVYKFDPVMFRYGLPYILAAGAAFVCTTVPDIKGDLAIGKITTAGALGPASTMLFGILLLVGTITTGLFTKDWLIVSVAVISLPIYIYAWRKPTIKNILIAVRTSAPLLGILLGIMFPVLMAVAIGIVLSSKIYYKLRFNVTYPTIIPTREEVQE